MTPPAQPALEIRQLETPHEFDACVALQREVWGFNDTDLVPRRMFVVAHGVGGQVLGAFSGETLAGYTLAFPGLRAGQPYLHSHMLAVAPAFRNAGVGRRLKLRQRELALAQDIKLIEWTFDPLEIKNAWFNFSRLGAIARRYLPNHYGNSSSRLQAGLPTDRLVAEWWLGSRHVAAVLAGTPSDPAAVLDRVEVPATASAWRAAGDPRAVELQSRNREHLMRAFQSGFAAIGYERGGGDPAGGTFLLGRWEGD